MNALPSPARAAAPASTAPSHASRPDGRRLVLVAYVLLLGAALAAFGVDPVLGAIAGALNIVFAIYFFRHLAFAVSAARWAEADLLAPDVDLEGYTPQVAVFVGCKNEELVVDGMLTALLALDYPADRLTLVVVDDGSDDGTGDRLDHWAAIEPRLRVIHRAPGPAAASPAPSTTRWPRSRPRSSWSSTPTTSPSRTRCAAWSATSATPAWARSWAAASSATARSRRWPPRSSSTSSPATWSTSTAGRRCSSCPPTAAPTARCACPRCARSAAGTSRRSPRTPT